MQHRIRRRRTESRSTSARASLTPGTFAARYADAYPVLWCVAAGVLGERAGAEDVVQDAAMSALQKLEQFELGTSFLAWMSRFVRFQALNTVRRRVRRATSLSDPAVIDATVTAQASLRHDVLDAGGELRLDQSTFDDDVVRALRSLERIPRVCLLLRAVLDMPYHEIARALDIPEGTAMSHVHRARAALREMLGARSHPSTHEARPL